MLLGSSIHVFFVLYSRICIQIYVYIFTFFAYLIRTLSTHRGLLSHVHLVYMYTYTSCVSVHEICVHIHAYKDRVFGSIFIRMRVRIYRYTYIRWWITSLMHIPLFTYPFFDSIYTCIYTDTLCVSTCSYACNFWILYV